MKQLVSARAVIAIWTPNSIKSDWVRAEAGAAKKDGKLIPVIALGLLLLIALNELSKLGVDLNAPKLQG